MERRAVTRGDGRRLATAASRRRQTNELKITTTTVYLIGDAAAGRMSCVSNI
jgi:hypothetical protein